MMEKNIKFLRIHQKFCTMMCSGTPDQVGRDALAHLRHCRLDRKEVNKTFAQLKKDGEH